MNKELIISETEQFINDEIFYIQIEYGEKETANERFYLNTAKRLTKAYSLYKKNNIFKNDYILALRDFLITFDVSVRINQNEFLKNNKFGISFDDVERKYFASYQLSFDVNEKFVKEAFLREIQNKKSGNDNDNLTTDPMILNLTGYSKFKSLGQKLAVYGALNTPEGFTTLVSLPTGGGKSLITQTIAFQKEGLTIVIVPTVSLAIDQERVTKEIIKRDNKDGEIFSYSSGVDAEPILSAIKKKNARMLFISPEALLENPAFAKVIREANKDRYLKNIVIDEAHIVVDWGAAFRVDYQCLEAWRNMLLMTNPSLRTILLSATFEDNPLKGTIRQLLEKPEVQGISNKEIYERLVKASISVEENKLKDLIYHNFIIEVDHDLDDHDILLGNVMKRKVVAFLNNEIVHDFLLRKNGPIERMYSKIA